MTDDWRQIGMTARRRSLAVVAALVVWAVFVSAAFGSRVLVVAATDCCNPPGNPLDAPGVYGLIAQHGGMTRQEVTQKVHAAWRAFLVWALRRMVARRRDDAPPAAAAPHGS